MLDSIYNEDCLIGMQRIPDASIDAIITDLPYEVLHKSNPNAQWDRLLPLDKVWEQFLRVAKSDAPIILFGQGLFTARLMLSQPKIWKYNLIWEKDRCTGFLNANRMPMRNHEDICVFYREQPVYNPQMTRAEASNHPRGNGVHKHTNNCNGAHKELRNKVGSTYDYNHIRVVPQTSDPNLRFPRSVLQFKKEHGRDAWHPTQKPVALLRYLIRTFTDEGDTVLDATCGSGSTCIAAIRENRHFIGFELDENYFNKAMKSIVKERSQFTFSI